MMPEGQAERLAGGEARGQAKLAEGLFKVAAWRNAPEELSRSKLIFATHPFNQ
jgi:hypothetical protein